MSDQRSMEQRRTEEPMFYPERGAGELQRFLQDKRAELATLDVEMQKAHDVAEDTEERWTEHYDLAMARLEQLHDRLPGEDIRLSFARRHGDGRELWNLRSRAKRAVEKYERRHRLISDQISAAQSEAKIT